jgi:hypothetical protein
VPSGERAKHDAADTHRRRGSTFVGILLGVGLGFINEIVLRGSEAGPRPVLATVSGS